MHMMTARTTTTIHLLMFHIQTMMRLISIVRILLTTCGNNNRREHKMKWLFDKLDMGEMEIALLFIPTMIVIVGILLSSYL